MARSAAARRYARALFGIAQEDGRLQEVGRELAELGSLLESTPELRDALFRPLHPVAQRRGVLDAVAERLGASPHLRHFYSYLIDQRRFIDIEAIRTEFERLADEAAGRVPARVRSAAPLSEEQRERLRQALCQRTGRDVQLEVSVDESLVGGLVAQVGDLVFDGSIRTHLEQLRSNLAKGH